MSDSLGQGFTGSIVNSIPNYLSADQSILGQISGVTGSIQYVKLVWGGSGEANFVSESGSDPTALPVSLNNGDNWWLMDSILGSMTKVSGNTAFRVSIGEGITISGITLQVGTGMTLTGVNTGVILGITMAGRMGITADFIPVRNFKSAAGVTESIWVTGGVYVLGGTVGLNSANLSVNLGSGVTIAGFSGNLANAGVGVTFGNITFGTINANISSFAPGSTVGVAFTTPGGTFFPGGYLGIPVFGVNGTTAVGVTFSGNIGITQNGLLGVTFTGALSGQISLPPTGVSMHGTGGPNTAVGVTFGSVGITQTGLLGVTFPRVRIVPNEIQGTTFGMVFTNELGNPLGICGSAGVVGIPVFGITGATAINVTIVGGLSGINITGVSFGSTFQISGGTITRLQGGTLDVVSKIMAFGSAITIGNGTFGAWLAGGSASFHMSNPSNNPGFVKLASFQDAGSIALIDHLKGLTVAISGFGSSGLVFAGVSLEGGRLGPSGSTYLGVTMGNVNIGNWSSLSSNLPASFIVQGSAASRTTEPVGVTFPGIWGHTFSRDAANALGVTLLGVAIAGGALSVSVVGGLSGITVSGISFPDRFGISGGTLNAILGGTLDLVKSIGFVSGGSFNINNTAIGISFDKRSYYGITFGTFLLKPSGGSYDNIENGIPVVGVTNATPVAVTGSVFITGVTTPADTSNQKWLGVTFTGSLSTSLPITGITLSGSTFHIDSVCGGMLGVTTRGPVTVTGPVSIAGVTTPIDNATGHRYLGVTFTGSLATSLPITGITLSGATFLIDSVFGGMLGVTHRGPVTVTGPVSIAGVTTPIDNATGQRWLGVTLGRFPVLVTGDSSSNIGVTLGNGGRIHFSHGVTIFTESTHAHGVTFNVVKIRPESPQSTTFGVVLTNQSGIPFNGGTLGIPVFGHGIQAGITAIGVTFTGITFAGIVGVTFNGITFGVTRTLIVGSSFADGGGNLGIPVYGVAGTTAVRVSIEGGTVTGLFVTDAPGITVMGVSTGIPIIGITNGTPVGVTIFGPVQTSLSFPATGITLASAHGVTFGVSGGVEIFGEPTVKLKGSGASSQEVKITQNVPIIPGNDGLVMPNAAKMHGASLDRGLVVTEKHGSMFARGFTLSDWFIQTVSVPGQLPFGGGSTAWFFKAQPVCVTKDYNGIYKDGTITVGGGSEFSVPLKKGLYVQFTKWDLISHVFVGYTAGTTMDFEKDAQVLHREYQQVPIWANAINQFKLGDPSGVGASMASSPMVGAIEKPSRIFIPCKNAGELYIKPIGDYRTHTIGSGFWDYSQGASAAWSDFTLYERSWFASDYSGFTGHSQQAVDGGSPWFGVNGEGVGVFLTTEGPAIAGKSIDRILNSYTHNPFVRVWGY